MYGEGEVAKAKVFKEMHGAKVGGGGRREKVFKPKTPLWKGVMDFS